MTALTVRAIPAARRASALYCATYGNGMPLLLIHGFGACGEAFQPLALRFAARYQSIVPDLRGHGQSHRLPLAESITRLANDIRDLLDLLGVQSTYVVGHAGGAAVALQLAADQPARVRGLALISPPPPLPAARRPFGSRLRSGLAAMLGQNESAGNHDVHACQRLLQQFDYTPLLRAITMPTLVIAGSDDQASTPRNANALAHALRNAAPAVIAGGGARMPQTHHAALTDVLLPWLETQERIA